VPSAAIVYWYSRTELRHDGGGIRALAWEQALRDIGYDTEIVGLIPGHGGGPARKALLSRAKRALIPTPLLRSLPSSALDADLVVATVPSVIGDALKRIPPDGLVLDWMDLWSTWSRNVGDATLLSRPGGRLQSRLWARREHRWSAGARANAYAGYEDWERARPGHAGSGLWLPTPVPLRRTPAASRGVRTVGFIGNLDYLPNEISLREFLDSWAGRFQQSGIRMVVAGYGSDKVAGWGFDVDILGAVDELSSFYDLIDAAIVPIAHGAGIKVKAVEALSFGKPVFATDHVRAGFAPELRPMMLGLDDLARLDTENDRDIEVDFDSDLFIRTFSQEAFTRKVEQLRDALARPGVPSG
jgi:glycosyltransferase involved in cell wall biosynthesis